MPEAQTASVTGTIVGLTDVGRVREHNEDSFLVLNRADGRRAGNAERFEVKLDAAVLLVVCDGMGGAAAGEVASRMAADRLAATLGAADFAASTPDQVASLMDQAVQQANAEIHKCAQENPAQKGMGTTLTGAVVTPGRLFISQVGDSRAYLFRKGFLNQLTKDQSLIGQLIEEGTLTEEEAEKLGGRNIVLQAVGVEESLRVDTKYWDLLRGDVLLLCSDGLSGMVKDARLKEILAAGDDLPAAAHKLIAEANENGGRDNITAIVARFDGEGLRPPMEAAGDDLEKAGVSFKAPPPPDVPNPMRKMGWVGLVVLALIGALFLFLRKTTADLQISAEPAGVPIHLVLTAKDGTRHETDSAGGAARIEGVKPAEGEFRLVASAPDYFDDVQTFPIAEPSVVKDIRVAPIPMPGTATVTSSKTPRVVLQIYAPGTHPKQKPHDARYPLPEAGQRRDLTDVPAGPVTATATRDGFKSWSQTQTLPPNGAISFAVPALEEITGTLVVRCERDGATVEVVDERGESLGSGEIRAGEAKLQVRIGRHSVRVRLRGFKDSEEWVDVEVSVVAVLVVSLEVAKVPVTFVSPGKGDGTIHVARNDGSWPKVVDVLLDPGRSRAYQLEPGNYELRWRVGGQDRTPWKFSVAAGDPPKEIVLR